MPGRVRKLQFLSLLGKAFHWLCLWGIRAIPCLDGSFATLEQSYIMHCVPSGQWYWGDSWHQKTAIAPSQACKEGEYCLLYLE